MRNQSLSIFTFPIWWYGEGLALAWRHFQANCRVVLRSTGLLIFLKNISQPLYGDTTRQGRIISVFLRIVLLFFILGWTGLRLLFAFILLLTHVLALPVCVIMVIYQLFSLFSA